MAFRLVDRVRETTISPGTGTATLAGAALGYQSFSTGVGANNTTYYVIADQSGANWEVGYGTVGAGGTTLARTTVLSSSNAGSLVNFSSGTQDVWVDYPATKAVFQDSTGTVSVPVLLTTSTTSTTPNLSFNASNSGFSAGASISGNYFQSLLQNKSGTAGASTNYVLSNDLGTDSTYYGEFGMNSSVFSASTPADFFSINNGIYFSGHDGDISIGSGNGFKTYLAWGTTGQSAHVINASGALGFSTNLGTTPTLTGTTGYGTAGQPLLSGGSSAAPSYGTLGTSAGGTGLTTTPANGALDIGNGSGFTRTTLTAGSGIKVTNAAGSITITNTQAPFTANYLVVAGGGGSSGGQGEPSGGGGAGGVISASATLTPGTTYTVTVGAGGAGASGGSTQGNSGSNSQFGSFTAAIGGGAGATAKFLGAASGGSGGGGSGWAASGGSGVNGASGTSGQGNAGGNNTASVDNPGYASCGGGGAGAAGTGVTNATQNQGGNGGIGIQSSITGTAVYYGGGGAGGVLSLGTGGTGGLGGGGNGCGPSNNSNGSSGTANTGGGGGGANLNGTGGSGGSGIVILAIPTVNYSGVYAGSPTITTSGANTILQFTASGSYTA